MGGFGQPAATGGGGLFGASAPAQPTSAFGASTTGFGAKPTLGGFGAAPSTTSFGTTQTTANPFGAASQQKPAFGAAPTSGGLFGTMGF